MFGHFWLNFSVTSFAMAEAAKKVEIFPDEKGFFKLEDGNQTVTCR